MSKAERQGYDGGAPWIWGYIRGGLVGATVSGGVLVPEEDVQIAVYGWDDDGVWVYTGEAELSPVDEFLTASDGFLCAAFLDYEKGVYHPFPGCGVTSLTIPDAPS